MKGSVADEYSLNDVRLECLASEMVSSILIVFALFPHTNNISCDFLPGRIQNKQTGSRKKFYFFLLFSFLLFSLKCNLQSMHFLTIF
jgi:hypothetical protein